MLKTLNVSHICKHTLDEYDLFTLKIIKKYHSRGYKCIYILLDFKQNVIVEKNTYSVVFVEFSKKTVTFQNCKHIWPIMIGSKLDQYITHERSKKTYDTILITPEELVNSELDNICAKPTRVTKKLIAITCFIINGILKQLPYFITNNPEIYHVFKGNVKKYSYSVDNSIAISYDAELKTLSIKDTKNRELDKAAIVKIDGLSSIFNAPLQDHVANFVDQYVTDLKTYLDIVYAEKNLINNLKNKVIYSPGSFLYRLVNKNILFYIPKLSYDKKLKTFKNTKKLDAVERLKRNKRAAMVKKAINNGQLLFVISKTSQIYKEQKRISRVTFTSSEQYQNGQQNQKCFEKKKSCYREILLTRYQLIPHFSQIIYKIISDRANTNYTAFSFDESYIGFFCGCVSSDSKSIGKLSILTRDTEISYVSKNDYNDFIDQVIHPTIRANKSCYHRDNKYHLLIFNNIPIRISLGYKKLLLSRFKIFKRTFRYIECYEYMCESKQDSAVNEKSILIIRYTSNILFKRIKFGYNVTSADFFYWLAQEMPDGTTEERIDSLGYDFYTSYITDILPYYNFNPIHKIRTVPTALRNSVLALTDKYSNFYKETMNIYLKDHSTYKNVQEPENEFSVAWTIKLPLLNVAFHSFEGLTQEDALVLNKQTAENVLWIRKNYRVRYNITNCSTPQFLMFCPSKGLLSNERNEHRLGTLYNSMGQRFNLSCSTQTATFILDKMSSSTSNGSKDSTYTNNSYSLYLKKQGKWQIKKYKFNEMKSCLIITLENEHCVSTGDKLSNLHGQKGICVARDQSKLPVFMKSLNSNLENNLSVPDLLQNPISLIKRQTMGQIKEMIENGGDQLHVYNPRMETHKLETGFIGECFYLIIDFLCHEKMYEASKCIFDKITGQPVKGTSRTGGLRAGSMEVQTGIRANGLAAMGEEKLFVDSDMTIIKVNNEDNTSYYTPIPKNIHMCLTDAKTLKVDFSFKTEPMIVDDYEQRAIQF
jgi:RNA polymerase Rpb2, domain 6